MASESEANLEYEIFLAALEQGKEGREEYLLQACGDNKKLLERLSKMLHAHEVEDSFMARPALHVHATNPQGMPAANSLIEAEIGPYKLLRVIGEGGMGTVYMAEQSKPVHRRVALKIIKAGMDSKQVIARFEAECQALAIMDHPNIAKVIDAGTTQSGHPYFVMELVRVFRSLPTAMI